MAKDVEIKDPGVERSFRQTGAIGVLVCEQLGIVTKGEASKLIGQLKNGEVIVTAVPTSD